MSLCLTERIEGISRRVTGRPSGMFEADCAERGGAIAEVVRGRRVLVAGGAGSIGAATILELLSHQPAALGVLDPSENNLAELIRTIRAGASGGGSSGGVFAGELGVEPLPYGSPLAVAWLGAQKPFDVVLSFAALKHVRSERDVYSTLRMLEVNLLEADRFLAALRRHGHGTAGVFFVSTDKAADPVSLMGASKRAMELLLWAHATPGAPLSLADGGAGAELPRVTSARFANVAFSDGSLPWAFLQRLEKRQPLAAPSDVRRYLVSPRESGQLCLLAALACPHRHLLVPALDPARDLVSFTDIAAETLRAHGLEPAWYDDEATARAHLDADLAAKRHPVVRTVSDTSGEKQVEEFVGRDERALDVGLRAARGVAAGGVDVGAMCALLAIVRQACAGSRMAKDDLVTALTAVVPGMKHRETGRSLDGKM